MNLVANQSTYTMPADLLMIRSLRYKYSDMLSYKAIIYKSMQQFDEAIDGWDGTLIGSGSPIMFTRDVGQVILFPTPDRASTNGLKILYNQKPTDVANLVDSLSLPLIYHPTVFKYCMWQASLLDEDHEPAVMYQANFNDDVGELQGRENRDALNTYPVITIREEDM